MNAPASELDALLPRLGELRGEHAEVLDDGRVAGHRALDHVRKDLGHVLVEDEVRHLVQGLGEESVGLLFHGGRFTAEKAGILAERGARGNRATRAMLSPPQAGSARRSHSTCAGD